MDEEDRHVAARKGTSGQKQTQLPSWCPTEKENHDYYNNKNAFFVDPEEMAVIFFSVPDN